MARTVRFRACVLLLLVALSVSPAVAAGRRASEKRDAPGVFSLLWETLDKLVPALEKSRGSMDPNGSPTPTSPTQGGESDSRGSMDPNG
jgi:hypothetical protein